MTPIHTLNAPAPAGHYSQAIVHNGLVFVSGQLPIRAANPEWKASGIEEQAEQVLANLDAILLAAGSDREKVLKVTVYISDIALWGAVNTVYADYFKGHKPARAIVPVRDLHHGYQIELEATAFV